MDYQWLDAYCAAKPGASWEFKAEWNAIRYMVGGKMFGMRGHDSASRPIVTLKLDPLEGEVLRERYPDVIPGYYMNKQHWNSAYLEGRVPDEVLRDMADKSYALIFASLPKKAREKIAG